MSDARPNPAADLLGLLGAANPLPAIGKTVEQFRTSVDAMLRAVSAFTETMEALSGAANRVNRLLDDIEEPIRAVVPRVTAAVKVTEGMIDQLLDPVERVSPLLSGVAESLSSPSFRKLPTQLGEFLELIGNLTTRLSPLSQMLESAGGLFTLSPWRNVLGIAGQDSGSALPGTAASPPPEAPVAARWSPAPPPPTRAPVVAGAQAKAPAKRVASEPAMKKTAATPKKAAGKKAPAKQAAKKTAAKKTAGAPKRAATTRAAGPPASPSSGSRRAAR